MKSWDEMLTSFRQLGGIADNVRLGEGKYGRGLFPVDNDKPVKLQVPKQLLLPVEWLEIDEFGVPRLAQACNWDEGTKIFYLNYLIQYSLTPALIAELMDEQAQLFNLPAGIKGMLINYGVDAFCFEAPSFQSALDRFNRSRQIRLDDKSYLMPVIELTNHSGKSKHGFTITPNVGFKGKFKDEILVNYGTQADALFFYLVYGFSEPSQYAFSGTASLNLGPVTLNVSRFTQLSRQIGDVKAPRMRFNGEVIDLSFLMLANTANKKTPKHTFVQIMQHVGMPLAIANEVFDGLVTQNIGFLTALLEELKSAQGTVAARLTMAIKNQLFAYSIQ